MTITIVLTLIFLALLFARVPIGIALLAVGFGGIAAVADFNIAIGILSSTTYRSVATTTYLAIPLFIFMASVLAESNIAKELFRTIGMWINRLPGGLGIAAVGASAGFGALSGSSTAATTVMAKVAVPALREARYPDRFSTGLVATTTGTLAALIPPSIPLILYGIQTETPIAQLFIAGIVPGLLIAGLVSAYIFVRGLSIKSKSEPYSWGQKFRALKDLAAPLVLLTILVAVIYFGLATPTEAAAFGAVGALVIGAVMRRLNIAKVYRAAVETVISTSMIFLIVIGANVFSQYVSLSRVGSDLVSFIGRMDISPLAVIIVIVLMYLMLGLFLDLVGAMLITLPLVFPLAMSVGADPVWFGILVVLVLEIGLVTPPVGMNLFITSQKSGVEVNEVLKGSVPFIFLLLFAVALLVAFPGIALILT